MSDGCRLAHRRATRMERQAVQTKATPRAPTEARAVSKVRVRLEETGAAEGGEESADGDAMAMVGADSMGMPRAAEAAAAVARWLESELCTLADVDKAGTATVAVMMTEAAVTEMVTSEGSTPAAAAMLSTRLEVSA